MDQENSVQFRKAVQLEIRQQPGEETEDRKYYRARISSNRLDSHFSEMDISTLENFAKESAAGVAVLDSHNHRTVGIGRSISGDLIENEVFSDFYILKDLELNNQSFRTSDSFMKAIDSGMLQDVSVGFYGHTEICQICNEELWFSACRHWPGQSYIIEVDGKQEIVVCTTLIIDGHLSEFSLVYDGALEGASIVEKSIQKAQRLSDTEQLTLEQKKLLNLTHQIQFRDGKAIYEGKSNSTNNEPIILKNLDLDKSDKLRLVSEPDSSDLKNNLKKEPNKMNNEDRLQKEVEELQTDLRNIKEVNTRLKTENEDLVTLKVELETLRDRNNILESKFTDKNETIETLYREKTELKQEMEKLMPIVEEGKKARIEAESDALTEYIRYKGEDLTEADQKSQKDFLSHLPNIEQVRNFRNQYADIANQKYPSGQKVKQPAAPGTDPEDDKPGNEPVRTPFEPTVDAF